MIARTWARRFFGAAALIAAIATFVYIVRFGRMAPTPESRRPAAPTAPAAASATPARSPESHSVLRIGWTAWADAELVSRIAERLLEDRMGYEVELVMADIGIQYQGVASGDLDAMLMAWLPVTHRSYWNRVSDDVVNLGPLYTGARLGWAVPDYVPAAELGSIEDLARPAVADRLGRRIQGIDPGSGLMQASETALRTYGLDYELVSSSGAAMTAAVDRAIRRGEWIVVTTWSPHWMFARWDLRYLDDPHEQLASHERVHAIVRRGFDRDFGDPATGLLTRMFFPLGELQAAMLDASEHSVGAAVDRYIDAHPKRIEYWVTGRLE